MPTDGRARLVQAMSFAIEVICTLGVEPEPKILTFLHAVRTEESRGDLMIKCMSDHVGVPAKVFNMADFRFDWPVIRDEEVFRTNAHRPRVTL